MNPSRMNTNQHADALRAAVDNLVQRTTAMQAHLAAGFPASASQHSNRIAKRAAPTVTVEGYACRWDDKAEDGESITRKAIDAALPAYLRFATVREMHKDSAVGKVLSAKTDAKGLLVRIEVVDPVAALKCESGVYKGLSISFLARQCINKVNTEVALREISLVDVPSMRSCVFRVVNSEA